MVSNWQIRPLGDVVDIYDGPHATPEKSQSGPIFLGISNLAGGRLDLSETEHLSEEDYVRWTRRVTPQVGDVVFSYETRLGEAALIPDGLRCCLGRRMGLLRPKMQAIDSHFLLYAFLGSEFQETLRERTVHGSTVDRIPLVEMPKFPIRVPPIHEQRTIGQMLHALDCKIDIDHRMNDTLEKIARATFKSWFLDFDPVRAKAEGREPALPPHISGLFPDSLVQSELGEIPKGWVIRTAGELAERIAMGPFGSSIKVETFVNQGIPIISGQHLRNFILEDSTFNFITEEHGQKLAKAIVKRGDVIFTHAGNIGQVSLIPANSRYDQYVISQRQFFMRCDLSRVSPLFIAFYFSSPDGRHRLLANTSSSGVPSIARPVSYLRSIPLIVPQSALLATFDRLITPLVQQIRDNWNNIRTLNATRDALLPKLVSGELRVTGR